MCHLEAVFVKKQTHDFAHHSTCALLKRVYLPAYATRMSYTQIYHVFSAASRLLEPRPCGSPLT